jgi:regulatory protein
MASDHQDKRERQQSGCKLAVGDGSPWMKASDLLKPLSSESGAEMSSPVRSLRRRRSFSVSSLSQSAPSDASTGWRSESERMEELEARGPELTRSRMRPPEKKASAKKASVKKASTNKAREKKVPEVDRSETESPVTESPVTKRYETERPEVETPVTESGPSEALNQKAFAQRYNACLDWLSRREHSAFELERKLNGRFPEEGNLVPLVLAQLQASGLQDDYRFAEMLVRYRASRGQGPIKIRAELKSKGVAQDVVSEALSGSTFDWSEVASSAITKKYGEPSETSLTPKERARRQRFLQSRGFPYEHIVAAL